MDHSRLIQHVNVRWPNADVRSGSGVGPQDSLFFIPRSAAPIEQMGPAGSVALRILGLATEGRDGLDSPEEADLM
jgi:hypothetical protein